jgi:predicted DCC family thiol-disulfide oxidoreductase YuxK
MMLKEWEGLVLLYDERCVLCQNTVRTLSKLETAVPLTMLPLQQVDISSILPGLQEEQLLAQLHVVTQDRQVFKGADAVFRILREVPSYRWITSLERVPGFRAWARVLYRLIAKYRYRLFGKTEDCPDGVCSIHDRSKK